MAHVADAVPHIVRLALAEDRHSCRWSAAADPQELAVRWICRRRSRRSGHSTCPRSRSTDTCRSAANEPNSLETFSTRAQRVEPVGLRGLRGHRLFLAIPAVVVADCWNWRGIRARIAGRRRRLLLRCHSRLSSPASRPVLPAHTCWRISPAMPSRGNTPSRPIVPIASACASSLKVSGGGSDPL